MQLTNIKGVSLKRQEELNKCGIYTVENLLKKFPKSYLDLRKVTPVRFCYHNELTLTLARVVSIPKTFVSGKKTRYVKVVCEQNGDLFTAVWFNQPYVLQKLKEGKEYLFFGRVKNSFSATSLINPTFEEADKNNRLKGIIPVYQIKGSIYQSVFRSFINNALSVYNVQSAIPYDVAQKYNLGELKSAYYAVHNPDTFENVRLASERIAVEEYFLLISAFKVIKGQVKTDRVNRYTTTAEQVKEFSDRFGFTFTGGQKKAVNEIFSDLKSNSVMNRLLQGDVGSGKTAVAVTAMYTVLKSGYQTVFLAPTEVLAEQNYSIAKKYLSEYECVFLSGSQTAKEKRLAKEAIKDGRAKIVVGTHAVLQSDVEFFNLGLCVCDEQHRFGVSQRSSLLSKGVKPDLLVMSATPIPRTLSLIFYGDLDVSTIEGKPINRAQVKTHVVPNRKYDSMINFILGHIKNGRQAFFVCPQIDGDEEGTIMSVTELYNDLCSIMPEVSIGLLHGKMKDKEKNAVMQDFKNKKYSALVSTTVIEVGVDVPNANVMVIYNAERFGLSQLHQLRGRVGRSDIESFCFLLSDSEGEKAIERLRIMAETSDGFKIAEYDYDQRGGGDFLGTRQSGKFVTDLGALQYPVSAIFTAKKISDEVFATCKDLEQIKRYAIEKYDKLKDVSLN